MKFFLTNALFLPRNMFIAFLFVYRKAVSPVYGNVCKYYPSCSLYAVHSLQEKGFLLGTVYIICRILRCNPWSYGGVDEIKLTKHYISKHGFVYVINERKTSKV